MRRVIREPKRCHEDCECDLCVPGDDSTCYDCDELNLVRMDALGNRKMRVSREPSGQVVLED